MNSPADRSDCSRLRFSAIEDVTKNVRAPATTRDELEFRVGIDIRQRLKPNVLLAAVTARLEGVP